MFSFKRMKKRSISQPDRESSTKLPLTERNIEFLNQQEQDAGHEVQRPREVQISEWLRLLPRVRSSLASGHIKLTVMLDLKLWTEPYQSEPTPLRNHHMAFMPKSYLVQPLQHPVMRINRRGSTASFPLLLTLPSNLENRLHTIPIQKAESCIKFQINFDGTPSTWTRP